MTGAWRGGLALSNAVTLGVTPATSQTLSVFGSTTTTYAKGAWAQAVASAASDSTWMQVFAQTATSGGSAFAVDVGVGASGSEVVVVSNLCFSQLSSWAASYLFPLAIQAGTRIAVRASSNLTFDVLQAQLITFDDTFSSVGVGSGVDTYGFSNATNYGTAIDPGGTANTKGAYSQISASLTNDLSGFMLCFDNQANGGSALVTTLVDIAVGGSGSEVVIIPNYCLVYTLGGSQNSMPGAVSHYLPIPIAAGTRVAARAQCSTATSPDRIIGMSFYGVRL